MSKQESYENVFTRSLEQGLDKGYWSQTQNSIDWFRNNVIKMNRGVSPHALMADGDRLKTRPAVGQMYLYFYDPKWKKELPYYDRFPLVIVLEQYRDGFLGLNLHYLPPKLRAVLLGKLLDLATDKRWDERTKLKISYDILKSAAKYKEFKPCVKRYLNNHLRSRFLKVNPREWQVAIFLPVERFEKKTKTAVWQDSRGRV